MVHLVINYERKNQHQFLYAVQLKNNVVWFNNNFCFASYHKLLIMLWYACQKKFMVVITGLVTNLCTLTHFLALFPQTCSIMRADGKFLAIIPCMLGFLPEYVKDIP